MKKTRIFGSLLGGLWASHGSFRSARPGSTGKTHPYRRVNSSPPLPSFGDSAPGPWRPCDFIAPAVREAKIELRRSIGFGLWRPWPSLGVPWPPLGLPLASPEPPFGLPLASPWPHLAPPWLHLAHPWRHFVVPCAHLASRWAHLALPWSYLASPWRPLATHWHPSASFWRLVKLLLCPLALFLETFVETVTPGPSRPGWVSQRSLPLIVAPTPPGHFGRGPRSPAPGLS